LVSLGTVERPRGAELHAGAHEEWVGVGLGLGERVEFNTWIVKMLVLNAIFLKYQNVDVLPC
jgi:hypothetical protein